MGNVVHCSRITSFFLKDNVLSKLVEVGSFGELDGQFWVNALALLSLDVLGDDFLGGG